MLQLAYSKRSRCARWFIQNFWIRVRERGIHKQLWLQIIKLEIVSRRQKSPVIQMAETIQREGIESTKDSQFLSLLWVFLFIYTIFHFLFSVFNYFTQKSFTFVLFNRPLRSANSREREPSLVLPAFWLKRRWRRNKKRIKISIIKWYLEKTKFIIQLLLLLVHLKILTKLKENIS